MMNKPRTTILLLLTLLAFTLAAQAQAQDVTITVATDQPGWTISKYLTGMHTVYGNEPDACWENPIMADWMKSADVGIIRYPGGTAVQHWHWDDPSGISFGSDSWDPNYNEKARDPKQWMNLEEYITYCRKIGAEPMVGVNIRSGKEYNRRDESLESARRLIQHCKDRDYRVKHWYIGNECFIGWNPKTYAKEIDDYAGVLRQVDPDITIIGDWKFGPESKKRFAQTIKIVRLSKELDVMEIHEKYGLSDDGWGLRLDGHTSDSAKGWQQEAGLYDGRFDQYIELFYEKTKGRKRPIKLAFNEWAAANETPYLSALTKADYLISMFKHPVYSACDWSLHSGKGAPLQFKKRSEKLTLLPAAKVFTMISDAMGQIHLPMTTTQKNVYGFAAQADAESKAIQIYVLNKQPNKVATKIELGNFGEKSKLSIQISSLVDPGKVVTTKPAIVKVGDLPHVELPPLSFSRILVSAEAPVPSAGKVYTYKEVDGVKRELEIHFPKNHESAKKPVPAIIFFHGGGWGGGTRKAFRPQCKYFASRGIVAATVTYRLVTKEDRAAMKGKGSAKSLCIPDVKSAIRWYKQHADELGIDPNRIIVGGGSAGGHISLIGTNNRGLNDPQDPEGFDTSPVAYVLFNPALSIFDARDKETDFIQHLTANTAPAIAFFGDQDKWLKGWKPTYEKWKSLEKTSIEVHIAKGEGHAFFSKQPWLDLTLLEADKFLQKQGLLKGEPTLTAPAGKKLELQTD